MMFPRTQKTSLTKKILSVSLIGCITVTITAAAMQPFLVYASVGSGTLRGVLIGLSALMGTGNINAASLNTLNSSAYMSDISAYSSANISESDLNAILSSDAGIARWIAPMSNNAQQVKLAQEYVSAAGGDPSGLQGLGAASAAKNIQASIDYYLEHGELKPSFGGQTMTDNIMGAAVMQSMADVAYNFDNVMWYARENGWTDEQIDSLFDSGAAFGDLQGAIDYVENLDKTITKGQNVNVNDTVLNNIGVNTNGCGAYSTQYFGGWGRFYYNDYTLAYMFPSGAGTRLTFVSDRQTSYKKQTNNGALIDRYVRTKYGNYYYENEYSYESNTYTNIFGFISVNNLSQAVSDYANKKQNGYSLKSPDIITNDGQAQGTWTQDANANNRNQFNLCLYLN